MHCVFQYQGLAFELLGDCLRAGQQYRHVHITVTL